MARTASDLLCDRLIAWGVDTIFGFPGDGIDGFFDSLRTHQDKLHFYQVRHEESAAFAACGYAKYTGRLGVCVATSGPGGIHLLNGLYDATMDGVPVLAITGNTFHDLMGTHQQQDVALNKLFDNVATYSERVSGPAHAINALDEAIRLALTHRKVAHVNIPKDIQVWTMDEEPRSQDNVPHHSGDIWNAPRPIPPPSELQRAADVLNAGHKVVILAGRGALGARAELEQMADLVAGPIVKPLLGKAVIPDDSPYTTGGIGLLGTKPSVDAMRDCDTLLIVGSTFPYEGFYPKPGQARCVQIDLDAAHLGLRYPAEVPLPGDSMDILRALLPLVQRKSDRGFLQKAQDGARDWWKLMEERGTSTAMPMKPQVVAWELSKLLPDNAIIAADTGTCTSWIAQNAMIKGNQMFTASGLLATMGNGLPYAIGAQVAYPDRPVVAFVGDGGLTMLMGELATCAKYKLPIKVIVIKNNVLGMIKWEQMILSGDPQFAVELQPIDFAQVARACGMAGFTVDKPQDVRATLEQALAHPGPALVDAIVDPNEPPMPPTVTREEAINFAEALLKGQPHSLDIVKHVAEEYARQVV